MASHGRGDAGAAGARGHQRRDHQAIVRGPECFAAILDRYYAQIHGYAARRLGQHLAISTTWPHPGIGKVRVKPRLPGHRTSRADDRTLLEVCRSTSWPWRATEDSLKCRGYPVAEGVLAAPCSCEGGARSSLTRACSGNGNPIDRSSS